MQVLSLFCFCFCFVDVVVGGGGEKTGRVDPGDETYPSTYSIPFYEPINQRTNQSNPIRSTNQSTDRPINHSTL
jgi:hypothetical protein